MTIGPIELQKPSLKAGKCRCRFGCADVDGRLAGTFTSPYKLTPRLGH